MPRVVLMVLVMACGSSSAVPAPAPATGPQVPVPAASAPSAGFQANDAAFGAWIAGLKEVILPLTTPPTGGDPVDKPIGERFVCGTRFFPCGDLGVGATLQAVGRLDVSAQAVGIVVHGAGADASVTGLLTYDGSGRIIGGQIFGAAYGKKGWGFEGQLSDGLKLERSRYVGAGEAKEYADQETFRVRPTGSVDLTVE